MIPQFFTVQPSWDVQIARISAAVGRLNSAESREPSKLELRRTNRLSAVHSSAVIEGNRLSLKETTALASGEPVFAPARDVVEMQNALAAYEALDTFDPWIVADFLRAHSMLMEGLVSQAGAFRTVDVDIVNASGEVIHTGSQKAKVPRLIAELLEWGQAGEEHPLVVASATHFLIEHIHPFRDGNGRIGRLWQTLVMSRWEPLLGWTPTETLIREHQAAYYQALQMSREPEIDAAPFISFMLDVIEDSLQRYESASQVNVGINVGINPPPDVDLTQTILQLIGNDPKVTGAQLAEQVGVTPRHVDRLIKTLREAGRLTRIGSRKTGQWQVIHPTEAPIIR